MSIKKIALIAATLAITTTAASANNAFDLGNNLESGSTYDLGLVVADNAGVLKIYDYSNGQQGVLLGEKTVRAGANSDVKVNVDLNNAKGVLAVLEINGEAVKSKDYNIVN